MTKKFLLLILLCSTLVSCKDKHTLLSDLFKSEEECYLKELNYPADSIMKPNFIYSFENFIILSEPASDYLLSSYNTSTQEFNRFLTKGRGPGELLNIQQIGRFKDNSMFFAKSTYINNEGVFVFKSSGNQLYMLSKILIPDNASSMYVDGDMFIFSQYGNQRYSIYNSIDQSKIEFGDDISYENYSQNVISHLLDGYCTGSVYRKRIAMFSIYGDSYEIYDYKDSSQIKNIKQFAVLPPISSIQDDLPVMNMDSKFGVPSVSSSNKYIYALYNEKTIRDGLELREDVFFCNKILVFDWDGNPVKLLKVDKNLRSISYNEQQRILYGVGKDENHNLKIYYLDKLELI